MTWIRNNLKIVVPVGLVLAGVLAFLAFGVFGIHTKFIDDEVAESAPVFASEANAVESAEPAPVVTASSVENSTGDVTPDADVDADADADADAGPDPAAESVSEPAAAIEPSVDPAAEPSDETSAEPSVDQANAAAPGEIVTLVEGTFVDRSHPGSGIATVLNDGTAQRFLRFEEFETDNGPDLFVYLTRADASADAGAFGVDGDFVNLGRLKGNVGDQNYEIPVDVDLSEFDTVVVWCDRFSVAFTAADLF